MRFIKLALPLLFILTLFWVYNQLFIATSKADSLGAKDFFDVSAGENFRHVAQRLHDDSLIRNVQFFSLYAQMLDLDVRVLPGHYKLEPGSNPLMILDALTDSERPTARITVPEGATTFEISSKLVTLGIFGVEAAAVSQLSADQSVDFPFLPSDRHLEGYLFPDTYAIVARPFDLFELQKRMLKNFEEKVFIGLAEELKRAKHSLADIVIMASIIEKEVKTKEDMPIVAGILWKRLENGWPLQADATLIYGKKSRAITSETLADDSPYNTYTRLGLPLTAIGNPGVATIRAAAMPVDSEYWFYITDSNDRVIYARTNEEHEKNIRTYLR